MKRHIEVGGPAYVEHIDGWSRMLLVENRTRHQAHVIILTILLACPNTAK
jgi:hypothetical protein